MSLVLAVETSCDETSAAVVEGGCRVRSNIVSSQVELHAAYGGVVPELASRSHLEALLPVVEQALTVARAQPGDLDAVAVTTGPGLVGALVVGLAGASSLALAWEKPLVPVNHLEAHAYAAFLASPDEPDGSCRPMPVPPMVVLIVSGGHTILAELEAHVQFRPLGETRDDAAGEAYDKVARYLGLGYPGGPVLDRLAVAGNPEAIAFPRAMLEPGSLDFSFSGLKTAVVYHVRESLKAGREVRLEDVVASFQAAVVDVLVAKAFRAVRLTGCTRLAVVGGVAANSALRRALGERARTEGVEVFVPALEFCTDNAAMVAGLAHFLITTGHVGKDPVRVNPSLSLGGHLRKRGRKTSRKPYLPHL